jgi:hypothetical protein
VNQIGHSRLTPPARDWSEAVGLMLSDKRDKHTVYNPRSCLPVAEAIPGNGSPTVLGHGQRSIPKDDNER